MAFNHKVASALIRGIRVSGEEVREFVTEAANNHDISVARGVVLSELQQKNSALEGEIALLKEALVEA